MAEFNKIAGLRRLDQLAALKASEAEIFGPETQLVFFTEPTGVSQNWMELVKPARGLAERLYKTKTVPVLATRSASSSLAKALRKCGWAILEVPAHGQTRPEENVILAADQFRGRNLNVLISLWQLQVELFSSSELANLSKVSVSFAGRVLRDSVLRGWTTVRTSKRQNIYQVCKPLSLMNAILSSAGSLPESWRHFAVPPGDLSAVPRLLDSFCQARGLTYSVTGTYAANYYLRRWTGVVELQFRMSSTSEISAFQHHIRAIPVETGGNIAVFISLVDVHWLFRTRVDGIELANPLIVASDLVRIGHPLSYALQNYLHGSAPAPEA